MHDLPILSGITEEVQLVSILSHCSSCPKDLRGDRDDTCHGNLNNLPLHTDSQNIENERMTSPLTCTDTANKSTM